MEDDWTTKFEEAPCKPYECSYSESDYVDYDALLEQMFGGSRLRSPRAFECGGEWDYYRSLSATDRRRLVSGGYVVRNGFSPDQLATDHEYAYGRIIDADRATQLYVDAALRAMNYRQSNEYKNARNRAARARKATANGFPTYYAYRKAYEAARAGRAVAPWPSPVTNVTNGFMFPAPTSLRISASVQIPTTWREPQ